MYTVKELYIRLHFSFHILSDNTKQIFSMVYDMTSREEVTRTQVHTESYQRCVKIMVWIPPGEIKLKTHYYCMQTKLKVRFGMYTKIKI